MIWQVPKIWEGGECWIIGGGPSVPHVFGVPEDVISAVLSEEQPLSSYSPYLSPIHDRHVIGVNAAFMLGDWIDFVFFGDGGFYLRNKKEMDAFSKVKVTCHTHVIRRKDLRDVKYIPVDRRHNQGISSAEWAVSWNLNSGAAAINFAYHLGVKRIYLLGFDMKSSPEGAQHWHRHYAAGKPLQRRDKKKLPFHRHLPCFPMVANDAKRLGLEIVNVNPDSEITVFKRVKLSDVL